jgi:hypothetical protein
VNRNEKTGILKNEKLPSGNIPFHGFYVFRRASGSGQ